MLLPPGICLAKDRFLKEANAAPAADDISFTRATFYDVPLGESLR
jgi:hypothetical protein